MHVTVVGAGIGGLAAALAVRQAGHTVTLLEQVANPSEIGAGIGLASNATAALRMLGADKYLAASAIVPQAWQRRDAHDGSVIAAIDLGSDVSHLFGDPFWTVHRGDLYSSLRKTLVATESSQTEMVNGAQVTSIDTAVGSVTTADGRRYTADLVVLASGIHAGRISGAPVDSVERFTGNVAFRMQFDSAVIADLAPAVDLAPLGDIQSWLGNTGHLVTMTIRSGDMVNFTFCLTEDTPLDGRSSAPAAVSDLQERITDWWDPIREIVAAGTSTHRWDIYDIAPLDTWVDQRCVVVGDAAHAMMPYLGQGAAQALEDAVALGKALTNAELANLPRALQAFEETRRPRATLVQQRSRENRDLFHAGTPERTAERNRILSSEAAAIENSRWLWELPAY